MRLGRVNLPALWPLYRRNRLWLLERGSNVRDPR